MTPPPPDGPRLPEPAHHEPRRTDRAALWVALAGGAAAWVPGTFLSTFPAYYESPWPWAGSALVWVTAGVLLERSQPRADVGRRIAAATGIAATSVLPQVLTAVSATTAMPTPPWAEVVRAALVALAAGVFVVTSAGAAYRDVVARRAA